MIFGQCDCCGTPNRVLRQGGRLLGMDAYACAICRNGELGEDINDLEDEIYHLRSKAKTDKQWEHIGALKAALVEARAEFNETHGQFGVGA